MKQEQRHSTSLFDRLRAQAGQAPTIRFRKRKRVPGGWEYKHPSPFTGLTGSSLFSSIYAITAIVIGCMIIAGALLGWIRPLWFSSTLLILSNVLIGVSAFTLIRIHYGRGADARSRLIREALHRALESRN